MRISLCLGIPLMLFASHSPPSRAPAHGQSACMVKAPIWSQRLSVKPLKSRLPPSRSHAPRSRARGRFDPRRHGRRSKSEGRPFDAVHVALAPVFSLSLSLVWTRPRAEAGARPAEPYTRDRLRTEARNRAVSPGGCAQRRTRDRTSGSSESSGSSVIADRLPRRRQATGRPRRHHADHDQALHCNHGNRRTTGRVHVE
jgi:hypothetical protein